MNDDTAIGLKGPRTPFDEQVFAPVLGPPERPERTKAVEAEAPELPLRESMRDTLEAAVRKGDMSQDWARTLFALSSVDAPFGGLPDQAIRLPEAGKLIAEHALEGQELKAGDEGAQARNVALMDWNTRSKRHQIGNILFSSAAREFYEVRLGSAPGTVKFRPLQQRSPHEPTRVDIRP